MNNKASAIYCKYEQWEYIMSISKVQRAGSNEAACESVLDKNQKEGGRCNLIKQFFRHLFITSSSTSRCSPLLFSIHHFLLRFLQYLVGGNNNKKFENQRNITSSRYYMHEQEIYFNPEIANVIY